MATLKDAAGLTGRLQELSGELNSELTESDVDFARMADLASEISQQADALASTFTSVNETLTQHVKAVGSRSRNED